VSSRGEEEEEEEEAVSCCLLLVVAVVVVVVVVLAPVLDEDAAPRPRLPFVVAILTVVVPVSHYHPHLYDHGW